MIALKHRNCLSLAPQFIAGNWESEKFQNRFNGFFPLEEGKSNGRLGLYVFCKAIV